MKTESEGHVIKLLVSHYPAVCQSQATCRQAKSYIKYSFNTQETHQRYEENKRPREQTLQKR